MAIQAHGKPTGSRAAVSVQPAPRIGLAFGVLNLRAHRTLADDRQGSINDRIIGGLVWGSAACPRSTPKYTANGCLKSTRSCLHFLLEAEPTHDNDIPENKSHSGNFGNSLKFVMHMNHDGREATICAHQGSINSSVVVVLNARGAAGRRGESHGSASHIYMCVSDAWEWSMHHPTSLTAKPEGRKDGTTPQQWVSAVRRWSRILERVEASYELRAAGCGLRFNPRPESERAMRGADYVRASIGRLLPSEFRTPTLFDIHIHILLLRRFHIASQSKINQTSIILSTARYRCGVIVPYLAATVLKRNIRYGHAPDALPPSSGFNPQQRSSRAYPQPGPVAQRSSDEPDNLGIALNGVRSVPFGEYGMRTKPTYIILEARATGSVCPLSSAICTMRPSAPAGVASDQSRDIHRGCSAGGEGDHRAVSLGSISGTRRSGTNGVCAGVGRRMSDESLGICIRRRQGGRIRYCGDAADEISARNGSVVNAQDVSEAHKIDGCLADVGRRYPQ
ncbi:hypothetical protein B0H14DRAFT_2561550 [Mycena olivaceomarginata]|nr:hypothetical protein B0H14DRAFT_2561550 [Mycena olivaceomarginata]